MFDCINKITIYSSKSLSLIDLGVTLRAQKQLSSPGAFLKLQFTLCSFCLSVDTRKIWKLHETPQVFHSLLLPYFGRDKSTFMLFQSELSLQIYVKNKINAVMMLSLRTHYTLISEVNGRIFI